MTWLITGGAGYIGAHVVRAMREAGEAVVVFDDLSTGDRSRVPADVPFVRGSTLDGARLRHTMDEFSVRGVVHLAAKKQVAESVELPLHYYRENVQGLQVLLEASTESQVRAFLFSSSAAVYGMPDVKLVGEDTPCAPINPYGETKLAGEWMVRAAGRAHGLHALLQCRGCSHARARRHWGVQSRSHGLREADGRNSARDLRR
jgi:UDP-glucose 4-epimerase